MNIVEEIGVVVSRTAVKMGRSITYMFGHPIEITGRLQAIVSDPSKPEVFPMIILFTDIPVDRNQSEGFYGNARLQIIIANYTQPTYTAPERLELNFKPILQPIRDAFLKQLESYPVFQFPGSLKFREIERYFWGKQGLNGNEANEFNDYIDCIELQNVQVNVTNTIICISTKKNF